jgi:hypothetical protein
MPDQVDNELELDDEEDEQAAKTASSAAAQALAAAQREAIAGPGRLVALQVCTEKLLKSRAWCSRRMLQLVAKLQERLHCTFVVHTQCLVSSGT